MKHWLVIYDICDAKRLRRVAKKLEGHGTRVQKSVFELEAPAAVIADLRRRIAEIIKDDDFVVYFDLCQKCWQKKLAYGPEEFQDHDEKEFYVL